MVQPNADSSNDLQAMNVRDPAKPSAGSQYSGRKPASSAVRRICLLSGRCLLLFGLFYVTWRFGGTEAVTLFHCSLMLLVACILTLFSQPRLGLRAKPMPLMLFAVTALAVAWPMLQTLELWPSVFASAARGSLEVNRSFVDRTYDAADAALLRSVSPPAAGMQAPAHRHSVSVVRSLTYARIQQWTLMAAFVVLSALLFDTRKSRKFLLWTFAINAACLSVWGLIQRSTGTTDLLPGVSKHGVIMPFATFVYKNAGAAALIPGFAAAMGLVWAIWLPPFRRSRTGTRRSNSVAGSSSSHHRRRFKSTGEYSSSPWWVQPKSLILLVVSGLVASGLLVSYSRGAWFAVASAVVVTLLVNRDHVSMRAVAIWAGVPAILCLVLISTTSLFDIVSKGVDRLSPGDVYADGRWQHWPEGMRAASKHFPVGSGLGTYGYATLAEQKSNTNLWFREAHNQYLETITEQGIPGILIVVLGCYLIWKYSIALLNNRVSRERSATGLVGLLTLVAIGIQSSIDFVVLIPAVMFLIAVLIGMVAQAYAAEICPKSFFTVEDKRNFNFGAARRLLATPATWLGIVFASLILVQARYRDRLFVDKVLLETRLIAEDYRPSEQEIEDNLERLTESLQRQADSSSVYQRRAQWHLFDFRIAFQKASAKSGTEMAWESTSPDTLFQILMSLPEATRATVVDEILNTPEIREPLIAAIVDLQTSISLNPLVPQVHLLGALLAPAIDMNHQPYVDSLCRLSHCNPRLQFGAGLIGYCIGDHDLMLEQWRQSLRGTTPEFEQIVGLCRQTLPLPEVISKLVPDDRSVLLVPMIRALPQEDIVQLSSDPELIAMLESRITSDSTRTAGQQQSQLGWTWMELNQPQRSAQHWKAAVDADRANAEYRFHYCRALLKTGDYEEVLRQTALGQSLELDGDRFKKLADTARRKLPTKTGKRLGNPRF